MGIIAILACFGILAYLLYDDYKTKARRGKRQRAKTTAVWMTYPPRIYIPAALGLLLALIYHDIVISLFFIVIGVGITWYLSLRLHIAQRLKDDTQVLELVIAFRGIFKVRPAIFAALEEARKKIPEPLQGHIAATVQAFYVTSSPQKAYAELRRRIRNPYLDQFVFILERSETAHREVVYQALDNLAARMRRHEDLRSKSEVNLAAITGQTTFIQVISLLIIIAIGLWSTVREYYVATMSTRVLFMVLVLVALSTSWYIDMRTQAIKERVL